MYNPSRSIASEYPLLRRNVFMAKAVVDKDACVGCETCVGTCPVEAISMVDGKALVDESCIECGSCVSVCPVSAITQ
jgi:Fe-S-cluster-containing hydrogenase component 2